MAYWSELGFAWRGFMRRPGLPILAASVLAVGLGGAIAVFSGLYAALLRPLPYRDPAGLVTVHEEFPGIGVTGMSVSAPVYREIESRKDAFVSAAAYHFNDFTLTGAGYARHLDIVNTTASLFPLLGVEPELGRVFTSAEDQPGAAPVVVLSHKLWREVFGADPSIAGRAITLDGRPVRVIGVMPASFHFPYPATQAWAPLALEPQPFTEAGWMRHWLRVIARPASGAEGLGGALLREHPDVLKPEYRWSLSITPLVDESARPVRRWIYLAFGAVLCLLLAACLNVAGLLLARTTAQRGEIAVRAALGASPPRLAARLFAESALLSAAGCAAGLLLARWLVAALNRWSPIHDASILPAVYGFAAFLGLGCALASGVIPAVAASRVPILEAIKSSGSPGVTGGGFWSGVIPAVQIAAALTLLTSGAVLTRSFLRLLETPSGLVPGRVFCATVQLPSRSPQERHGAFFRDLQAAIAALPSVERASGAVWLPFSSGNNYTPVRIAERPGLKPQPAPLSNSVLPGYFETLGIPLEAGRLFTPSDAAGTEPVIVVDREFARQYLGGLDPVGLHIESGGVVRRVIGVAGSVKTSALDAAALPFVYLPFSQAPNSALMLAVKTKAGVRPESIANDVRRALAGLRPDVALFETGTMEERIADSMKIRRVVAALLDGFAAAAALLAALGLYGVLSHSVELRRRELAIRAAVGALPADIVGTVASSSARILLSGLAMGIPASLAAARAFQGLLFGAGAVDPGSLAGAVILLAGVAAAASWLPARRALGADPLHLLRDR